VHLVRFVIRIYHDARSPERQIRLIQRKIMIIKCYEMSVLCGFVELQSARSIHIRVNRKVQSYRLV